jgi:membrane protease subunit (stomatin/prohibitin family)
MWVHDEDGGFLEVSWNNAMAFCRELTERERAHGRLRDGHIFSLPTAKQLDRWFEGGGSIEAKGVRWLWTLDAEGVDWGTREPLQVARAIGGSRNSRMIRQSRPPANGVGFIVVLKPEK